MDIVRKVALMRLKYHANMLSINNVLNQLHLRNDVKAEYVGKKHCMLCIDCMDRMGLPTEDMFKK